MARIWRAESTNDDPRIGGVVFEFPSGARKVATWVFDRPIIETRTAAMQYVTSVVEAMLKADMHDDIQRTNWTSCVAAVEKHIRDWNENLRSHLTARELAMLAANSQVH